MVIKSIYFSDKEILEAINILYLNGAGLELDPTFSRGVIYKGLSEPTMKFDLEPQRLDIYEADCQQLPLDDKTVNSIMFDPPFMFGVHGKTLQYKMTKRFTMFTSFEELRAMYQNSLKEFYRILKPKGYLIFKCQDYTDSKTTMTHCLIYNWAIAAGFYAEDIFILIPKGGRIYNSNLRQRHSRKFHCYYWVFRKV